MGQFTGPRGSRARTGGDPCPGDGSLDRQFPASAQRAGVCRSLANHRAHADGSCQEPRSQHSQPGPGSVGRRFRGPPAPDLRAVTNPGCGRAESRGGGDCVDRQPGGTEGQGSCGAKLSAAAKLGGLDWRAAPGIPALIAAPKDPESAVRVAAAHALGKLGPYSQAAVQPLLMHCEVRQAASRAGILRHSESIAGGSAAGAEAHRDSLRDGDAGVRVTAVTFGKVPSDDAWVAARRVGAGRSGGRGTASVRPQPGGDPVAHPAVIPLPAKGLEEEKSSKAVQAVLDEHLENTTEVRRVRPGPRRSWPTSDDVESAIPALRGAPASRHEETVGGSTRCWDGSCPSGV